MFQLSELRKHQLVEAHVRVYCVRHEREAVNVAREASVDGLSQRSSFSALPTGDKSRAAGIQAQKDERFQVETAFFQTHNVRLQHPDDELGSLLLMALPNVVVHRIDEWSPLCAPPVWYDEKGRRHVWRGMAPPNLAGETLGGDDGNDDVEDLDVEYNNIQQNKVVAGFPELLQRACDKEADARVLLQTEYGLAARRDARLARNMADSTDFLQSGAGGPDSPSGKMSRTMSDGDLIIDGIDIDLSNDDLDMNRRGKVKSDAERVSGSNFGTRVGLGNRKPSYSTNADLERKVHTTQHSSRHPYSTVQPSETPRERAKRKNDYNEQRELKAFLKDREAELVVLVEGIDVMTSYTLQARHSYRWDDIAWNHTFKPCVSRKTKVVDGGEIRSDGCVIDFSLFHDLEPVPSDCSATPLVSNIG